MTDSYHSETTRPLFRGVQIVWYLFSLLEILLAFRFILKLTGANPGAGFTYFIYTLSFPFVAPFLAVFRLTQVEGSVFEWTTLLAMIVYWIVAWALIRLFVMSRTVSRVQAAEKLEREGENDPV